MIHHRSSLLFLASLVLAGPAYADREIPTQSKVCLRPELEQVRKAEAAPVPANDNRRIVLSPQERQETGIVAVDVGRSIASGGMATVHEATYIDAAGKETKGVIKILKNAEAAKAEEKGSQLHRDLSKVYKKFRKKEDQFFVPAEAHIARQTPEGVVYDVVMPRAGAPVNVLQRSRKILLQRVDGKLVGEAPELEKIIRRNARLAWSQCRALGDLGYARVVHRDIKGGNIAIFGGINNTIEEVDAGVAHFAYLDFGIAELAGTPPDLDKIMGTVGYMAPEVMAPLKPIDRASDVFSAATLMAEHLLGAPGTYAADHNLPWVKVLVPRKDKQPPIFYMTSAGVAAELKKVRDGLVAAKVSAPDLTLFDDMSRFVVNGLISNPEARMKALAADPHSIFKLDKLGADPHYVDRIPKEKINIPAPELPADGPGGAPDLDIPDLETPFVSQDAPTRARSLDDVLPVPEPEPAPAVRPQAPAKNDRLLRKRMF